VRVLAMTAMHHEHWFEPLSAFSNARTVHWLILNLANGQ
jgi:hypothetical protein